MVGAQAISSETSCPLASAVATKGCSEPCSGWRASSTAARRRVRRPALLALDLLHQHSDRRHRARPGRGDPAFRAPSPRPPRDRLSRGAAVLVFSASFLVLFTSLGGTTYPWGSPTIVGLGVAGAVLLVVFVFVERRATEPVLPLHLFSNRGFSATSLVGFIVGFAMFGAIVYLPVILQIVHGESPTTSGLRLLPLLVGLIICSTGSGMTISRTGRYRAFPIAGTALMTVGLVLLSQVGVGTSLLVTALYMFVLGVGLGCVMQVLVLIVQNAVPYPELGVATSGATFFRSIGESSAPRSSVRSSRTCSSATWSGISATRGCQPGYRAQRHAGHPGQTSAGRPSRHCRSLRGVDPNRVPDRRANRRHRVPRSLVHTPGGAPARSRRGSRTPIGNLTSVRSGGV